MVHYSLVIVMEALPRGLMTEDCPDDLVLLADSEEDEEEAAEMEEWIGKGIEGKCRENS